jgi:amino-acid N-acetyltransferase
MRARFAVRRAAAADLETLLSWLGTAGLPSADLSESSLPHFLVATEGGRNVGAVGVEQFGALGLLRSLVVTEGKRGLGAGSFLVTALEEAARARGIRELWLLTTDARAYFQQHGYRVRRREVAPAPIRGTAEFATLCPADSVLMSKKI